jgi:hypothetical protein
MDPSAFDILARGIAHTGTRRSLVALLAALPLGGLLSSLALDEAAAEHPLDRVQRRTPQRNRKQRNTNQNNNNQNNNNNNKNNQNGGGGLGGTQDVCGGCPQGQVCCVNSGHGVCCPSNQCCGVKGFATCGCPCCAGQCCPNQCCSGQCCNTNQHCDSEFMCSDND